MAEYWEVLDAEGNKTGRLHARGRPMAKGEYHLTVCVWIVNAKSQFLLSKRTANKSCPNMWECTGGSAVAGDDSLTTALKEVREELGLVLKPENGVLLKRLRVGPDVYREGGEWVDIWLFRQEAELASLVFEPEETCAAMWASKEEIDRMVEEGSFATWNLFSSVEELF